MNAIPGTAYDEPEEPSDLDDDAFCANAERDDGRWDVFLPDDDPGEPLPEPGDFWIDAEDTRSADE
jgi:hypothetical protein